MLSIKTIFIFSLFLASQMVLAALEIQPGLWKIEMKIRTAGEVIDPGKEIKKAMQELPKEEQVQMQQALEEMAGMDEQGRIDVCYEASHFKRINAATMFNDQECVSKLVKKTRSRVISEFLCMDGTTGKSTWIIHSKKKYTGIIKVISGAGEESEMVYRGKFTTPLCEELDGVMI